MRTRKKNKNKKKRKFIMAMTTNIDETNMAQFHKGLSEWWSEETEYAFQRIERWTALVRGYNRFKSERLSKGRQTMLDERVSNWNITSNKLIIEDSSLSPCFHNFKRNRRRSHHEEKMKINQNNVNSVLGYRSNDNLDSACLANYRYDHSIYFKTIGEIRNDKKTLKEINDDSKKENLLIDAEVVVEEEEEGEEEEEEEIEDESKDYEPRLVYHSMDYRFYLDNANSKFNSNRKDVNVRPITDLADLDLNSKIPNTVYHKNEVKSMLKINNKNMEITKDGTENRDDYDSGMFNHELKNEFRKSQSETKGGLNLKMIKPAGTINGFIVCQNNNVSSGIFLNDTRNVVSTYSSPCYR
ncbi:uncharacterized protein LOC124949602 [Vespa velutina]|uniref:uncharacterized protein LOC124949602 n=1 Tax=Vespa velutina TaxID=202808 RepID=UPI001FB1D0A9|nr:uncharacterized protein LOC124949602 [Vespa velutina]